jgi:hypothetical protein
MKSVLHAVSDRAGLLLRACGSRAGTRKRKYRGRSAGGIAARATSADRSEDILVWTLGPKRINGMIFPIENADSRARFQKRSLAVVSRPEEEVPQLSADAPFRSIRNVKADCQPFQAAFRASPSVPTQVDARTLLAESGMAFDGRHFSGNFESNDSFLSFDVCSWTPNSR